MIGTPPPTPLRVIEVLASGPAEGGGIGRFMRYVLRANATEPHLNIVAIVDPRGPGHWISTIWRLPAAILHLVMLRLRFGAKPVAHVHIAGRLSTLRKCAVIAVAHALGLRVVAHYHEYGYAAFLKTLPSPLRWLTVGILRGCAGHIVLGGNEAARLPAALGAQREAFSIVSTCAPADLLDAPRQTEAGVVDIVFVGALSDRKGVDDLLRAAARLVGETLPPWRLTFCGGGDVAARAARAHALGLAAQTRFLGHVDEARVRAQLGASAIFVLPSHAEGLSVALLEAMALGCAVVATPVGEQDSVLIDGENALVVSAGDVAGLAAALKRLIEDPALVRTLSQGARASIRNGRTSEISLQRIAAALRRASQM